MDRVSYYDRVFREDRDLEWNDAPGKKVVLSAFVELVRQQSNRIIDIGSGSGYFLNEVRKHNPVKADQTYCGIDISPEAVEKAQSTYQGIEFSVMNAEDLHFPENSFDVVLSYGAIEHVRNPLKALMEMSRILKAEGLFLMMIPALDYYRSEKMDEGWYEDTDANRQLQWNYLRATWEGMFRQARLTLFDLDFSRAFGALRPGVFFFGRK